MTGTSLTSPLPALLRDFSQTIAELNSGTVADFVQRAAPPNAAFEAWLKQAFTHRSLIAAETIGELDDSSSALVQGLNELLRSWVSWAYEHNQFFDFNAAAKSKLRAIHIEFFKGINQAAGTCDEDASFSQRGWSCLAQYANALAKLFRTLVSAEGFGGRGAEYSAELQLSLLGVQLDQLREPIVDLGCGVDAKLVSHLRASGFAATGLERRSAAPSVVLADWFDLTFEPASIGTIISHLAFSLQFLHQHWQAGDRAYDYARKYMELLKSLIPGGSFYYAPGLPFIEALLDSREYDVVTSPLPEPLATTMASLRDIGTGQSVAYACRVRRR